MKTWAAPWPGSRPSRSSIFSLGSSTTSFTPIEIWLGSRIDVRPALRANPVVVPSQAITASVGILSWPATIPLTRPPSMIRSSTLLSVMREAPAFSACSASHLSNLARFAVKLPSGSLDSNSRENALSGVMNVMPSFRTNRSMGASFHESPRSFLRA